MRGGNPSLQWAFINGCTYCNIMSFPPRPLGCQGKDTFVNQISGCLLITGTIVCVWSIYKTHCSRHECNQLSYYAYYPQEFSKRQCLFSHVRGDLLATGYLNTLHRTELYHSYVSRYICIECQCLSSII